MKQINRNKAFTLVELLVVIAIVGIISGVIVVSMNGAINNANDVKRKTAIDQIKKALMSQKVLNGSYPIETTVCNVDGGCSNLSAALVPAFLSSLPAGPTGDHYTYYSSNGTDYQLTAVLSNSSIYQHIGSTGYSTSSSDCGSTLTYAGQTYNTIQIGTQCWMKENLNVGTMIASPATMPANDGIIEKWCNGASGSGHTTSDLAACTTYGGLYTWDEAMNYSTTEGIQGICPAGYHIPTDTEYKTLEMYLGMTQAQADAIGWRGTDQGTQLKSSSGFAALLPGYRNTNGPFCSRGVTTHLWSSSVSGASAWKRHLNSSDATVNRNADSRAYGFSVRCLKN